MTTTDARLGLVQRVKRLPDGRVKALVGSSRDPEVSHLVKYDGRAWACDCEAGSHGRVCWHVDAVKLRTKGQWEAALADFDAFAATLHAARAW